jgi:ketosteroid isomerase-like protein
MKKLIAVLFLMTTYQLNAQKSIDGLINIEKSFAAYSVEHGTKDAFLKFADSNGLVFDQGKAANAIEVWKKRENHSSSVLNWRPQFVEIASSNDFGYTTGPWELKQNANSDSVIARGQFVTIWHVDKNGEWKFLIDLGAGGSPKIGAYNCKKANWKKIKGLNSVDEVLKAEQDFINKYQLHRSGAYVYKSRNSILVRNGQYGSIGKLKQSETIRHTPSNIQFTITGSGIAPSGDLAYVYGNTIINNKQDNYLHIWRKEKDGWKIAVEVLRY